MNSNHLCASPCIRQCCLNDADICLGCFRSLQEIKLWVSADNNTRQQFLMNAQQRREQHLQRYHIKSSGMT